MKHSPIMQAVSYKVVASPSPPSAELAPPPGLAPPGLVPAPQSMQAAHPNPTIYHYIERLVLEGADTVILHEGFVYRLIEVEEDHVSHPIPNTTLHTLPQPEHCSFIFQRCGKKATQPIRLTQDQVISKTMELHNLLQHIVREKPTGVAVLDNPEVPTAQAVLDTVTTDVHDQLHVNHHRAVQAQQEAEFRAWIQVLRANQQRQAAAVFEGQKAQAQATATEILAARKAKKGKAAAAGTETAKPEIDPATPLSEDFMREGAEITKDFLNRYISKPDKGKTAASEETIEESGLSEQVQNILILVREAQRLREEKEKAKQEQREEQAARKKARKAEINDNSKRIRKRNASKRKAAQAANTANTKKPITTKGQAVLESLFEKEPSEDGSSEYDPTATNSASSSAHASDDEADTVVAQSSDSAGAASRLSQEQIRAQEQEIEKKLRNATRNTVRLTPKKERAKKAEARREAQRSEKRIKNHTNTQKDACLILAQKRDIQGMLRYICACKTHEDEEIQAAIKQTINDLINIFVDLGIYHKDRISNLKKAAAREYKLKQGQDKAFNTGKLAKAIKECTEHLHVCKVLAFLKGMRAQPNLNSDISEIWTWLDPVEMTDVEIPEGDRAEHPRQQLYSTPVYSADILNRKECKELFNFIVTFLHNNAATAFIKLLADGMKAELLVLDTVVHSLCSIYKGERDKFFKDKKAQVFKQSSTSEATAAKEKITYSETAIDHLELGGKITQTLALLLVRVNHALGEPDLNTQALRVATTLSLIYIGEIILLSEGIDIEKISSAEDLGGMAKGSAIMRAMGRHRKSTCPEKENAYHIFSIAPQLVTILPSIALALSSDSFKEEDGELSKEAEDLFRCFITQRHNIIIAGIESAIRFQTVALDAPRASKMLSLLLLYKKIAPGTQESDYDTTQLLLLANKEIMRNKTAQDSLAHRLLDMVMTDEVEPLTRAALIELLLSIPPKTLKKDQALTRVEKSYIKFMDTVLKTKIARAVSISEPLIARLLQHAVALYEFRPQYLLDILNHIGSRVVENPEEEFPMENRLAVAYIKLLQDLDSRELPPTQGWRFPWTRSTANAQDTVATLRGFEHPAEMPLTIAQIEKLIIEQLPIHMKTMSKSDIELLEGQLNKLKSPSSKNAIAIVKSHLYWREHINARLFYDNFVTDRKMQALYVLLGAAGLIKLWQAFRR